jgi:hypothetical protein
MAYECAARRNSWTREDVLKIVGEKKWRENMHRRIERLWRVEGSDDGLE